MRLILLILLLLTSALELKAEDLKSADQISTTTKKRWERVQNLFKENYTRMNFDLEEVKRITVELNEVFQALGPDAEDLMLQDFLKDKTYYSYYDSLSELSGKKITKILVQEFIANLALKSESSNAHFELRERLTHRKDLSKVIPILKKELKDPKTSEENKIKILEVLLSKKDNESVAIATEILNSSKSLNKELLLYPLVRGENKEEGLKQIEQIANSSPDEALRAKAVSIFLNHTENTNGQRFKKAEDFIKKYPTDKTVQCALSSLYLGYEYNPSPEEDSFLESILSLLEKTSASYSFKYNTIEHFSSYNFKKAEHIERLLRVAESTKPIDELAHFRILCSLAILQPKEDYYETLVKEIESYLPRDFHCLKSYKTKKNEEYLIQAYNVAVKKNQKTNINSILSTLAAMETKSSFEFLKSKLNENDLPNLPSTLTSSKYPEALNEISKIIDDPKYQKWSSDFAYLYAEKKESISAAELISLSKKITDHQSRKNIFKKIKPDQDTEDKIWNELMSNSSLRGNAFFWIKNNSKKYYDALKNSDIFKEAITQEWENPGTTGDAKIGIFQSVNNPLAQKTNLILEILPSSLDVATLNKEESRNSKFNLKKEYTEIYREAGKKAANALLNCPIKGLRIDDPWNMPIMGCGTDVERLDAIKTLLTGKGDDQLKSVLSRAMFKKKLFFSKGRELLDLKRVAARALAYFTHNNDVPQEVVQEAAELAELLIKNNDPVIRGLALESLASIAPERAAVFCSDLIKSGIKTNSIGQRVAIDLKTKNEFEAQSAVAVILSGEHFWKNKELIKEIHNQHWTEDVRDHFFNTDNGILKSLKNQNINLRNEVSLNAIKALRESYQTNLNGSLGLEINKKNSLKNTDYFRLRKILDYLEIRELEQTFLKSKTFDDSRYEDDTYFLSKLLEYESINPTNDFDIHHEKKSINELIKKINLQWSEDACRLTELYDELVNSNLSLMRSALLPYFYSKQKELDALSDQQLIQAFQNWINEVSPKTTDMHEDTLKKDSRIEGALKSCGIGRVVEPEYLKAILNDSTKERLIKEMRDERLFKLKRLILLNEIFSEQKTLSSQNLCKQKKSLSGEQENSTAPSQADRLDKDQKSDGPKNTEKNKNSAESAKDEK